MTRREFLRMARLLLKEHNLSNWTVRTDTAKSRCGACYHSTCSIHLSRWFVYQKSEDDIRRVLFHEIAHALLPVETETHGQEWSDLSYKLGGGREVKYAGIYLDREPRFVIAGTYREFLLHLKKVGLPRTNKKYVFISDPTRLHGRNKERVLCIGEYFKSPVWKYYRDLETTIQFINESFKPI